MADVIVILIVLAAVVPAVRYIAKEKKKGNACIGCPNSSACSGSNSCGCKHD